MGSALVHFQKYWLLNRLNQLFALHFYTLNTCINYKYCIVHSLLQNLLRHPLCLALVRRKWNKYGRYLYYMGLLRYSTFLAFLTSFALLTPNARTRLENGGNNGVVHQIFSPTSNSGSANIFNEKSILLTSSNNQNSEFRIPNIYN